MMKLRWKAGKAGWQRGAFVVFTALSLWFLMMFVAFAVDFGNYYQHRSRLQNAADAAALAGVAKYTEEEIAANSAGAVAAPTLSKGRLVTLVENDKAVPASITVRSQAQDYVTNNYGNVDIIDNKVWSEEVTEDKTENSVTQSITTTHRYCRVDLVDTIPTFFARIFGKDELTVEVSAMAMLDGSAVNETWGQRLTGIGERLAMLAPNQVWESLFWGDKTFTITGLRNRESPTTQSSGFGEKKKRYYVMRGVADALLYTGAEEAHQKHSDDNGIIIGYKDVDKDGNPITDGICALPIYLAPGISWESLPERRVSTKVFKIDDNPGVTYTTKNGKTLESGDTYTGEIFALYLNRDHIVQRTGSNDRFTKIIIDGDKGTGLKGSPLNPNSYKVPLYARLESELFRIGGQGLMTINGVFIEAKTSEAALVGGKIKPIVIAYDGPDPARCKMAPEVPGKLDAEDAPFIATEKTKLKAADFTDGKERVLDPAQIQSDIEPLRIGNTTVDKNHKLIKYQGVIPDTLVESSRTTPGPIEITIEEGKVFYGAIYAPRSKVIIKGTGKIYGFIAARKIEIQGGGIFTVVDTTTTAPTMTTLIRDRSNDDYDYAMDYMSATYHIAFSPGLYEDFTDPKYYQEFFDEKDENLKTLKNWN